MLLERLTLLQDDHKVPVSLLFSENIQKNYFCLQNVMDFYLKVFKYKEKHTEQKLVFRDNM